MGLGLSLRANEEFDRIEKKALAGFTQEEERQLSALLAKIKNNMNMKGETSNDKK